MSEWRRESCGICLLDRFGMGREGQREGRATGDGECTFSGATVDAHFGVRVTLASLSARRSMAFTSFATIPPFKSALAIASEQQTATTPTIRVLECMFAVTSICLLPEKREVGLRVEFERNQISPLPGQKV